MGVEFKGKGVNSTILKNHGRLIGAFNWVIGAGDYMC